MHRQFMQILCILNSIDKIKESISYCLARNLPVILNVYAFLYNSF